ncbi:CBO0543 family protein [Heyndrickxia acidiproducens]|uniref:CBO0543 family protein n=1 Tax=Heyndrickxia acidiproducens TaxID=1121084 RepID=UPI0003824DA0|nr:CBO0543 family protein [Heyndrickxia acidiproducens]
MIRKASTNSVLLTLLTAVPLLLLPFAIFKRPLKDWVIIYLVSIIGNSFLDKYLVSKRYLKYPVRPLAKIFKIHLPFDFIHYPLMLLYYNQWTLNSKPAGFILKLLSLVIPQVIFEMIAAKKTRLIVWNKGWSWQHSLLSLISKLLLCRGIIAIIRFFNNKISKRPKLL